MTNLTQKRFWLISAVVLGIAVDWLLIGQPLGIGLLLCCVLLLVLLVANAKLRHISAEIRNVWLIVPLIFFATMAFVRANEFLTMLNVLAVLGLLAYVATFYAAGRVRQLGLAASAVLPFSVALQSMAETVGASAEMVRQRGKQGDTPLKKGGSTLAVVRGGLLALPVLAVFTMLLASADLILAQGLDRLLSFNYLPQLDIWLSHAIVVAVTGGLLGGGILYALARPAHADEPNVIDRLSAEVPRHLSLGFGETATILTLVNLLFLTFCAIQAVYLFGGVQNIDLDGFTYAEYARRGFFELMTTAVLALGLILGLNWLTRRENKRQLHWFKLLSSLTVALVLVMLVSAWRRMALYEAAYGFTELRLIVFVAMAWLAILLGWFVITLWKRSDLFALGALLVAIGFVATLDVVNPDQLIAQRNLARYEQGGELDLLYLTRLSDDAVPVLTAALPRLQASATTMQDPICVRASGDEGDDCLVTHAEVLETHLAQRYEKRLDETEWQQWQSWHLGRERAFFALQILFRGAS